MGFGVGTSILSFLSIVSLALANEEDRNDLPLKGAATIVGPLIFRATMNATGHAALCGSLRLQISSCVAVDVGVIADGWYRWQLVSSLENAIGSAKDANPWQFGLPCLAFVVVHWLVLFGTNSLIWKVLRPRICPMLERRRRRTFEI